MKTSTDVWKHGLSHTCHMEEEKTYIKGPGTVGVRGVVAGEEGCRQCPLQPRDCPKVNSSVAV